MTTKTSKAAPAPRRITIENVGGIRHFVAEVFPGVNVLTGQNGAGKTSTMNAVARMYGADIQLEPRDGSDHGTVEDDRGVRLVIKKVARFFVQEARRRLAQFEELLIEAGKRP